MRTVLTSGLHQQGGTLSTGNGHTEHHIDVQLPTAFVCTAQKLVRQITAVALCFELLLHTKHTNKVTKNTWFRGSGHL